MNLKNWKIRVVYLFIALFFISSCYSAFSSAADIGLQKAMELALQNNGEITKSSIDRELADLDLELARKSRYPELNLQSSYTRMEEGPEMPALEMTDDPQNPFQFTTEEGPRDNYSTRISFTQPLYTGGRIRLGIEQAEKGIELAKNQLQKQQEDILFNTVQAYYNALLARARLEIEEESLKLVAEHLRMAEVSFENGIAIKTDLLQAQLEKNRAEQSLSQAENQYWLARKNLANLIGFQDIDFRLFEPEQLPEVKTEFEQLYDTALSSRPEMRSLILNREMTEKNLELEKRSRLPAFSLNGDYSWQGEEFGFDDGSWTLTIAGNISLYEGGKSSLEQKKIAGNLRQLEESRDSLEDMLEIELQQNLLELEEHKKNIELEEKNLSRAEENLRLEEKRFEAGAGRSVDVLQAQLAVKQARLAGKRSQYEYEKTLFNLLYKSGQLMEFVRRGSNG